VDLRLLDAEPTEAERQALDAFLGAPASAWEGAPRGDDGHVAHGGEAARRQRPLLLPALQAITERAGWISPGALNYVARRLSVPPADVYAVGSFYALLSFEPRPPIVVHVCDDIACRCAGSEELLGQLGERFGPEGAEPAGAGAMWLRSPCLGQCDRPVAALAGIAGEEPLEQALTGATADGILGVLGGERPPDEPAPVPPQSGDAGARLLRRIGQIDPGDLDEYRAHGGYRALRRAFDLGPVGVLREVSDSKLMGRGGAAFPMGRKWEAVASEPERPHYLVLNADESEPGTFKDRLLLEGDPFAVIESMTIAAYATGCAQGYVYLRGEYPTAHRRLEHALDTAQARGFLGRDILGHGVDFDVELRKGGGAYICGEETALFNSIEGWRGEPRNKPPFPVKAGLFGKPTVVNNVETIVNVLDIVLAGGRAFAQVGTERSTGTKLFCLCGAVAAPGVYEVPLGTTLRALLDLAGGVRGGRAMRGVLLGGAAGGFVGPGDLDLALSFEGAREAGTTLGSGVAFVLGDQVDLPAMLMTIAGFFRDESCGQCVPCRVGTVRQEEALARLASGRTRGNAADEVALLHEIGQAMRDASICGLGQTASAAVESAIERLGVFAEEAS
jgi:NADH-quinone oxidoreductase subunit F